MGGGDGGERPPPQKGKKVRISSSYSAVKVRYLVLCHEAIRRQTVAGPL